MSSATSQHAPLPPPPTLSSKPRRPLRRHRHGRNHLRQPPPPHTKTTACIEVRGCWPRQHTTLKSFYCSTSCIGPAVSTADAAAAALSTGLPLRLLSNSRRTWSCTLIRKASLSKRQRSARLRRPGLTLPATRAAAAPAPAAAAAAAAGSKARVALPMDPGRTAAGSSLGGFDPPTASIAVGSGGGGSDGGSNVDALFVTTE